ncbi:MAG: hypothetical protein ACK56I_05535, partial [bacterium]
AYTIIPAFPNKPLPFLPLDFISAVDALTDHGPAGVDISQVAVLEGRAGREGHEQRRQDGQLVVDKPRRR